MTDEPTPEKTPASINLPVGDRFDLSGDFRGAIINIKSTIVGDAEVKDIEDLPPEPGESPYQGLQYFDEKESDRFFGRDQLTAKIVGRLGQRSFLAVIGASGSGKSSLVRAGVIQALRRGDRLVDGSLPPTDSGKWAIHIFTPTAHPLEALASTLMREEESTTAITTLQQELYKDSKTLTLAGRKVLAQHSQKHLLLVIDQFEEIFTICRHEDERQAFIENLLAATSPDDPQPITILITLRADFYANFAQHDRLREIVSQNQEFIGSMTRDELTEAILKPAALGGWKIQEGLVRVMLDDVGDEPGALPLLSHALLETWERRRGRTMTLSGYTEAGGVRGAIAQTAESVFQQRLTSEQRPIARMIFVHLAELSEDSLDTRRRATFSELITRATDEMTIQAVLSILVDARLVTTDTIEPGDTKVVEVSHEALIREWPTLRQWLEQDREGLILHRQLTEDTNDWIKLDRDPGLLYRGVRLQQALDWAEKNTGMLSLLEQEFLDASRQEVQREAERERNLTRSRRLQRVLMGATAGLVVIVVVVLLFYTGVIALPRKMSGIYNIAVAEFSKTGPGSEVSQLKNGTGRLLSGWIANDLKDELKKDDPNVQVWPDNGNVKIKMVTGNSAQRNIDAASEIAKQFNAQMVVFGTVDTRENPAKLTLEIWIEPQYGYRFEEIQGNYQAGTPIPIINPDAPGLDIQPELKRQANTIAWLALGLTHVQLGQSQEALNAFLEAEKYSPDSEIVQFFIGREDLFLSDQQPDGHSTLEQAAEQAFKRSVQLNDQYARGYVGLGSIYFQRAQDLLNEAQSNTGGSPQTSQGYPQVQSLVDQAIAYYSHILELKADPALYGVPINSVAQLGLGDSYSLKGRAYVAAGDVEQAGKTLDLAIQTLEGLPQAFADARQSRYLTQAYEYLGTAYQLKGLFFEQKRDYKQSLVFYKQSMGFYDQCIAQGETTPDLIIKEDIIGKRCTPYRQEVQNVIDSLSGGQ